MISITIDPNVRVRGNQTLAGFEDADSIPQVGATVRVLEVESGANGLGQVLEVDRVRQLIFLAVDWAALTVP